MWTYNISFFWIGLYIQWIFIFLDSTTFLEITPNLNNSVLKWTPVGFIHPQWWSSPGWGWRSKIPRSHGFLHKGGHARSDQRSIWLDILALTAASSRCPRKSIEARQARHDPSPPCTSSILRFKGFLSQRFRQQFYTLNYRTQIPSPLFGVTTGERNVLQLINSCFKQDLVFLPQHNLGAPCCKSAFV